MNNDTKTAATIPNVETKKVVPNLENFYVIIFI